MIYRSKIDWWVYLAIAVMAALIVSSLAPQLTNGDLMGSLVGAGLLALSLGLPVWMLFDTGYRIDDEALAVHCGPFRWRIPRAEIEAVEPSRSPLSSPALSLDRLRIRYRSGRQLLVSPEDKDDFIRALAAPGAS